MRPTRQFLCVDCEYVWRTAFGAGRPETCPRCGSPCFGRLTWCQDAGPEGWQRRGARRTGHPSALSGAAGFHGIPPHHCHAVG
jgi:hypothetical protein